MRAVELTQEELLSLAVKAEGQRQEELVRAAAKFSEGDEVLWYESPAAPENRGEVQDVLLLGFPESPDRPRIGYTVWFEGRHARGAPEGCTAPVETLDLLESQLIPYAEGDPT